jgi:hypothetical protein
VAAGFMDSITSITSVKHNRKMKRNEIEEIEYVADWQPTMIDAKAYGKD